MVTVVGAIVLTAFGLVLLPIYFPLAIVPALAGALLSLGRRRFDSDRALFTVLAVVCTAVAVASLALDLTLLAADGDAPSTSVVPIEQP